MDVISHSACSRWQGASEHEDSCSLIPILIAASTPPNPNPGHMPVVTLDLWLRPQPRHVRIRRREVESGLRRPVSSVRSRPTGWLTARTAWKCRWLLPPLVRAAQARCWSLLALASGARLRTIQSHTAAFSHADTTGMTTGTASSGLLTRASVTSGAANDPDTRRRPGCYTHRMVASSHGLPPTTVLCQTHLMTGLPSLAFGPGLRALP
mmetsp:Transcript_10051/g.21190  ORF Transcript_10051/g.21190 Transcript_10051/m.21190 type:complete len:209 (+) Transcript_10051:156-782(+)